MYFTRISDMRARIFEVLRGDQVRLLSVTYTRHPIGIFCTSAVTFFCVGVYVHSCVRTTGFEIAKAKKRKHSVNGFYLA